MSIINKLLLNFPRHVSSTNQPSEYTIDQILSEIPLPIIPRAITTLYAPSDLAHTSRKEWTPNGTNGRSFPPADRVPNNPSPYQSSILWVARDRYRIIRTVPLANAALKKRSTEPIYFPLEKTRVRQNAYPAGVVGAHAVVQKYSLTSVSGARYGKAATTG